MDKQLPRNNIKGGRPAIAGVQKACWTAEVQALVRGAVTVPSFPTNFVPPMPNRPDKFPNISIEDHTKTHQASFLKIRRPMSAGMAKWVVQQLELTCLVGSPEEQAKKLASEVPVYSVALEFQDAYWNLGLPSPAALDKHIKELKRAKPTVDAKLKLETRTEYGPVVLGHAEGPMSMAVTALPAVSGRTYDKWDAKCREVYGSTIGLGALLAPATLVYRNLNKPVEVIRSALLAASVEPSTVEVAEEEELPVENPPKVRRISHPADGAQPPSFRSSTFAWVNEDWMREVDNIGTVSYHHKSCLPFGALKAPPGLPVVLDGGASRHLQPRRRSWGEVQHDLFLPGGGTLASRASGETEWRSAAVEL